MLKIKCIDNKGIQGQLKLNQEYYPESEKEAQYVIKLGNGVRGTYNKNRFERVEE